MQALATPGRIALALGLAFAAGNAAAKDLATFAATVHLPFDFKVDSRDFRQENSFRLGLSSTEGMDLVVLDGPLKGKKVRVYASYLAPRSIDAGTLQRYIREGSEKTGKEPGTKLAEPIAIDGFGFYLIDEMTGDSPDETKAKADAAGNGADAAKPDAAKPDAAKPDADEETKRAVRIRGSVNAAMLDVGIAVPADTDAATVDALVAAMRKPAFDFKDIMGLATAFDEERAARTKNSRLVTFAGEVAPPSGSTVSLLYSGVSRDGDNHVTGRGLTFNLQRVGFWSVQGVNVALRCDAMPDSDAKLRERLTGWPGKLTGISDKSPAGPLRLGGIDGQLATARRQDGSTRMELSHWYGFADGVGYELSIARAGGKSMEQELYRQLAGMKLACGSSDGYGLFGTPAAAVPPATAAAGK